MEYRLEGACDDDAENGVAEFVEEQARTIILSRGGDRRTGGHHGLLRLINSGI
ncbi:MAG: hypothetical protein M5R36_16235 [Deltaproteobacteria bacterium]|nr:hypothetical protein [Deltaproteobacteria bacterium]